MTFRRLDKQVQMRYEGEQRVYEVAAMLNYLYKQEEKFILRAANKHTLISLVNS